MTYISLKLFQENLYSSVCLCTCGTLTNVIIHFFLKMLMMASIVLEK